MKLFIHSVILYIKHLGPLLLSHAHYLFRILFSYYSNDSIGEISTVRVTILNVEREGVSRLTIVVSA
jgi:hypothetical protein